MATTLRDAWAALASTIQLPTVATAYATARDALDSGAMPPEIAAEIMLGRRAISDALRDAADVQRDMDCDDPETEEACAEFAAQLDLAATTLANTQA